MRKVLTAAGIVLAVLAVLAGAAWYLIDRQARIALDRVFLQMEKSGATASYETFRFDLLTQSVEVLGIRYESDGPTPLRLEVARLSAERIPLSVATIGATSLRLEGVEGSTLQGAFRTALVEMHDFAVPMAAINDAGGARIEHLIKAATAREAILPELTMTFDADRDSQEVVVRDIVVSDLKDGRIASAVLSSSSKRLRNAGGQTLQSAELGEGRIEGIDVAALARVALTRTENEAPFARVFDRITHQNARIMGSDGVNLNVGSVSLSGIGLRAGTTPLPEMAAIFAVAGQVTSAGARRIVAETAAELFTRFRFDRFEATDLALDARGAPQAVKIGRFSIDGLENALLGRVGLDAIEVGATTETAGPRPPVLRSLSAALETAGIAMSEGSMTVESLALSDLSLARFLEAFGVLVETVATGEKPSPDLMLRLLPEVSSLDLTRAEATLNTGVRASLARLGVRLVPGPDGLPKTASAKVSGLSIPLDPAGEASAGLIARGIKTLDLGFVADAARRQEGPGFDVRELTLSAGSLGALTLRAAVDGLGPEAAFLDGVAFRASLDHASLRKLELTFANSGAVERLLEFYAEWNGTTIDEARVMLPEAVKAILAQSSGEPMATDVSEAVRTFVADPRSLTLRLTPPRPVSMLELATAIETSPLSLFSLLTLSVGVNQ